MQPVLMDIEEFQIYLGISRDRTNSLLREPGCPYAIRLGKKIYANRKILDRWIEEQTGHVADGFCNLTIIIKTRKRLEFIFSLFFRVWISQTGRLNGVITDELIEALGIEDEIKEAAEKEAMMKEYSTAYSYNQIARDPDSFVGEKMKFRGKVLQEGDGGSGIRYICLAVNSDYDCVTAIVGVPIWIRL